MNCIVQRCLAGAPEQRFASALELKQELEGCRQLHHVQRSLPQSRWSLRYMLPHPWIWLVVIGLLPHLVGGFVQLSYNATRIVHQLSLPQQVLFPRMAIAFNPFLYSACLLWIVAYIVPVFRAWRRFQVDPCDAGCDIDVARQQAIGLPAKAALVGSVGWLCSAIFFPSVLHWRAGPLPWDAWIHFGISFLLAGSIAVAYGFILTQYVVLRIFYLDMWSSTRKFADRAGQELSDIEPRLRIFQWLAGAIPIMGAVVMVSVGPEKFSAGEYGTFRLFVTLLILSGMAGTRFATAIGRHVSALIRAISA